MIQSLLTQLSKQTGFTQKQNCQLQREVLVKRNITQSKHSNQSDNNIVPIKDKSFQKTAATNNIISQPESVIKRLQVDDVIKISGRGKQLRKVKSSDSSTSAEKKSVVILDDSMIEQVSGYEVSEKLENFKFLIRSFSRSKIKCMKVRMKPSMKQNPDHVILHIQTNDLNNDRAPDLIAKSIFHLTITMKYNCQNVSISNIVMRNDKLNDNAMEVNGQFK